jgi:hypothetical protein
MTIKTSMTRIKRATVTLHSQLARQGLARLALRRPEIRRRVAAFKDSTGEFESLCAAYEEACHALDGWRQSTAGNAELRMTEYQQLVADLESDLTQFVANKTH